MSDRSHAPTLALHACGQRSHPGVTLNSSKAGPCQTHTHTPKYTKTNTQACQGIGYIHGYTQALAHSKKGTYTLTNETQAHQMKR